MNVEREPNCFNYAIMISNGLLYYRAQGQQVCMIRKLLADFSALVSNQDIIDSNGAHSTFKQIISIHTTERWAII